MPLLAQVDPTQIDPSQFGPYAITVAVLLAIIWWLLKRLAKVEAQRDDLFREVIESGTRNTTALEHIGPILDTTNKLLARSER